MSLSKDRRKFMRRISQSRASHLAWEHAVNETLNRMIDADIERLLARDGINTGRPAPAGWEDLTNVR
jgi:hypothetical protein